MGDSPQKSWSSNPYAPPISFRTYNAEKTNYSGCVAGAILYGVVIVLSFRCVSVLLRPVDRARDGIKWGLVIHTLALFSFVTIYTATNLQFQSISYIDGREYPGVNGVFPPGPFGYQYFIYSEAISVTASVMFSLNGWLVDGLMLYRCYIIYAKNYWAVAFPFLMYLATVALGILLLMQISDYTSISLNNTAVINWGVPYYSISLALNILLTLMIVARLFLHRRDVLKAIGPLAGPDRVYNVIITLLVESCALYAVTYLLFIGPWAASSFVANTFFPILASAQVIAPLLITLRVADRRALTCDVASGTINTIHFASWAGSVGDGGTRCDEDTTT